MRAGVRTDDVDELPVFWLLLRGCRTHERKARVEAAELEPVIKMQGAGVVDVYSTGHLGNTGERCGTHRMLHEHAPEPAGS